MKCLPLFLALLAAGSLFAGDYEKKRPAGELALENLRNAQNMQNEANWLDEQASRSTGPDAATLKEFAKLTREEAGWLKKSGEAYSKNQIRLGEKYQQNAMEYCEKRGRMGPKMQAIHDRLKKEEHLKKEDWAQKEHDPKKPAHDKKDDHAKKDDWAPKPSHDKPGHDKPGHDKPGHDKPSHHKPSHDKVGHDKKDHPKPDPSSDEKQRKLAELERQQAELEAEKKKLLQE